MVSGASHPTPAATMLHRNLFLSAARREIMLGDFLEVGLGLEAGSSRGVPVSFVTDVFASSGARSFLTGIAFADRDGDRFYDAGEGRAGVALDILSDSVRTASTQAADGYAFRLPAGAEDDIAMQVRSGTVTMTVTLHRTEDNSKLDVAGGMLFMASTDMIPGTGGRDGRLLGAGAPSLTGVARRTA